jgi:hypothetical protein
MDAVDFSEFEVSQFIPHLFQRGFLYGCGGTALALLTGVHPSKIKNPNRRNCDDWTDSFMVRFLKKRGFRVQEVNIKGTNLLSDDYVTDPLQYNHVILASHMLSKTTASWIVIHDGLFYHNFSTHKLGAIELINHPILTFYLVTCKKWS